MRDFIIKATFATLAIFVATGCDFYEFDTAQPNDALSTDLAIIDLASARVARAGIYNELQFNGDTDNFDGYLGSWQYFSDDSDWSGTFQTREEFDIYSVVPSNNTLSVIFSQFYQIVNTANSFIDAVEIVDDEALTDTLAASLIAEARFARAIAYFHLTQGWTDVPLVLTPTRTTGTELFVAPDPQDAIYAQIIEDLLFARDNLNPDETLGMTPEAANAFLARISLYQGQYAAAYDYAIAALGSDSFQLGDFDYLRDILFSIDFNAADGNSMAFFYGPAALNGRYSIHPSDTLISSYEAGDERFAQSIDFLGGEPYGIKYGDFNSNGGAQTDPILLFRHAEQVLIAAEAAARQGDFDTAERWINQVRRRAGLDPFDDLDASNFQDRILQERFIELAMESGHRLWDLRRTDQAIRFLGPDGYDDCDDRWPIPQPEIDRNPNMVRNSACNS